MFTCDELQCRGLRLQLTLKDKTPSGEVNHRCHSSAVLRAKKKKKTKLVVPFPGNSNANSKFTLTHLMHRPFPAQFIVCLGSAKCHGNVFTANAHGVFCLCPLQMTQAIQVQPGCTAKDIFSSNPSELMNRMRCMKIEPAAVAVSCDLCLEWKLSIPSNVFQLKFYVFSTAEGVFVRYCQSLNSGTFSAPTGLCQVPIWKRANQSNT